MFQGHAKTLPEYTLSCTDDYPTLLEGGTTAVSGEVYDVLPHTLSQIDFFENVSSGLFTRRKVWLQEPFHDQMVHAYIFGALPSLLSE